MHIFTIGCAKTTAQQFFKLLQEAGVRRVVDVRLNNRSQLAGFTKARDLAWFLHEIASIDYVHELQLAPTSEMLAAYRTSPGSWPRYEMEFLALMTSRQIASTPPSSLGDSACLLCSEHRPDTCHRRLVAEYLQGQWSNVTITHLA